MMWVMQGVPNATTGVLAGGGLALKTEEEDGKYHKGRGEVGTGRRPGPRAADSFRRPQRAGAGPLGLPRLHLGFSPVRPILDFWPPEP